MILDKIKETRSHRNFSDKKISEEEILKILECVRYSSNAKNSQELRFFYTVDNEETKKLFKNISLGGALKEFQKSLINERPRGIIFILTKKEVSKNEKLLYYDIGIVSQNILLMANEFNYSTCIVMSFKKKEIKEILAIPKDYDIKALIVLGKGKEKIEIINAYKNNLKYFRKEKTHFLPKLTLKELIIKKGK